MKRNEIEKIDKYLNKIICGDCLEVMKELPDKSVDLVLTDPPYGMSFRSNHRTIKHKEIENDNNLNWLPAFTKEIYRLLKDDTHAYICCSFHNVDEFKQELGKLFKVKNLLVWQKNNTGMGDLEGDYAPQYELIFYLTKGNRKLNGRRDSNILSYKRTGNELHPTQKPVGLMAFLINKSSEEGGVVLDPFNGSGTTTEAAYKTRRNFIGIEISPDYCKIAKDRLKQQVLL